MMRSYRRLGYGNLRTMTAVMSFGIVLFSAAMALATPQYELTCEDCHRMPPLDSATGREPATGAFKGNHQSHADSTANSCMKCHGTAVQNYGAGHRDQIIQVTDNINGSPAGATYSRSALGFFNQTSVPPAPLGKCSNVNCHFETTTPNWGTVGVIDCAGCHSAEPTSNAHPKHTANGHTASCVKCHNDHTLDAGGPFRHATSAGRRAISVVGTGYNYALSNNRYLPSQSGGRTVGSCSNASCHDPYASGAGSTPAWNAANVGCVACHNGAYAFGAGSSAPPTGSHDAHMALSGADCGLCHAGAAKNTSGGSNHADGYVNVTNAYTMDGRVKHTPGTPGNAADYGSCLTAFCHTSPYSNDILPSPVWGATTGCAACHNNEGAFQSNGAPATGSHAKHMAVSGVGCSQCHSGAVSGVTGGYRHANGVVNVGNGYLPYSSVTKHAFGSDYTGYCSNATCHNDGNGNASNSPVWGTISTDCTPCHGGDSASAAPMATRRHAAHMNNYTTLGRGNDLKCAECHAKTVALANNRAIAFPASHNNGFKDYSGVKAGGSANYSTDSKECSNVYCHSSGQASPVFRNMTGSKSWGGSGKLTCSGCHGSESGAGWSNQIGAPAYRNNSSSTANSHQLHVAGASDTTVCARCHANTADGKIPNRLKDNSQAHLNRSRDVVFATYGNYSSNGMSCSATYCHSNVQAPLGTGPATSFAKPQWGRDNGKMTCGSCHSDMSTLPETADALQIGSHRRHAVSFLNNTSGGSGAGYSCGVCHGNGYSPNSVNAASHANGLIDTSFTGKAAGTVYSQAVGNTPGNGYGTCSTSKCHGRAVRSWGLNTSNPTCEKCHGSARTAQQYGTFYDTTISSQTFAGKHVKHLAATYATPVACNTCHVVPSSVTSFGHMSSLPARVVFSAVASYNSQQTGLPMAPSYDSASQTCNNTYCHAGVKTYALGSAPAPSWNSDGYGCGGCHGDPPGGSHPVVDKTNCKACHDHVNATGDGFTDPSKHLNGTVDTTADDCITCHANCDSSGFVNGVACFSKPLSGAHAAHTDVNYFLTGKKLSNGDFLDPGWIYSITYEKGFPKFACGFCHPMDPALHKNGQVDLDLDPSHSLLGTVKAKNAPAGTVPNGWVSSWLVQYQANTSVICSNVYCHSNGYISPATNTYTFRQTPDWYYADQHNGVSPWASVDRCNQCHGNSPNNDSVNQPGSAAHGKHVVAVHYKDVFQGYSGKAPAAGTSGLRAHGNAADSTTLTCNLCHWGTVQSSANDLGSACNGCHNGSAAPLKGTMSLYSSGTTHINGTVDVVFAPGFQVKSKAQVRDSLSSVPALNTSWSRFNGYKTYSTSFDQSQQTPSYTGGTCSTVACHNGTVMEWRTKGPLACQACHTAIPQ